LDSQQLTSFKYDRQEEIYRNTDDYVKLIELYKQRLTKEDLIETRLKLIATYIDMGDVESAEFNLNLLGTSDSFQSQISYLFALVHYKKEYFGAAAIYAKDAVAINNNYPEAENLLGLIYASLGQYDEARHYFYVARQHLVEDVKIKNNLAMLDILEGQYEQAIYRLEPLVVNGQEDEQVKANLALAYAKAGQYNSFKALYSDVISDMEIQQFFSVLRMTTSSTKGQGTTLATQ
jgi:tight adherence protein D